jgi:hypothetical protein
LDVGSIEGAFELFNNLKCIFLRASNGAHWLDYQESACKQKVSHNCPPRSPGR